MTIAKIVWCLSFVLLFSGKIFSAILVDDGGANTAHEDESTVQRSSLGTPTSTWKNPPASSVSELQTDKRVAAGVEFFGKTGLVGTELDFAFLPDDHASFGFGGGPGYVGMNLGYRHFFSETKLAPYVGVNLARWSSESSSSINSTSPSFLGQKFLSQSEMESGHFAHNFLIPTLGLQWTQLPQNAAFFGEVLAFVDADSFKNVFSGSLGMLYFF